MQVEELFFTNFIVIYFLVMRTVVATTVFGNWRLRKYFFKKKSFSFTGGNSASDSIMNVPKWLARVSLQYGQKAKKMLSLFFVVTVVLSYKFIYFWIIFYTVLIYFLQNFIYFMFSPFILSLSHLFYHYSLFRWHIVYLQKNPS